MPSSVSYKKKESECLLLKAIMQAIMYRYGQSKSLCLELRLVQMRRGDPLSGGTIGFSWLKCACVKREWTATAIYPPI